MSEMKNMSVESMDHAVMKVTLAVEGNAEYNFRIGDEVRLGHDYGRYVIVDENNRIAPASLVSNISRMEADVLADIKALFRITRIEDNVLNSNKRKKMFLSCARMIEICILTKSYAKLACAAFKKRL